MRPQVRRSLRAVAILSTALMTVGCVSTTLQVSGDHPAGPGAAAGRGADPAAVLRPDAALYASSTAVAQAPAVQEPKGTRNDPFVGRGTIRGIGDGSIVIQHQAIPGLMGAMTMAYAVSNEVNLKEFSEGDAVLFRIELVESGGSRIFGLEKSSSAESGRNAEHDHGVSDSQRAAPSPGQR